MQVANTAVFLLLSWLVTVMVPGQVLGQGERQAETSGTLRRNVPRDAETMVSSAVRYRYQGGPGLCSTRYIPALELVTPPMHGKVRFVTTDIGVPRGSGCSNSVYGQAVLYHPNPGFVGEDQFTYESPDDPMAMNWTGRPGLKTVILTVRQSDGSTR